MLLLTSYVFHEQIVRQPVHGDGQVPEPKDLGQPPVLLGDGIPVGLPVWHADWTDYAPGPEKFHKKHISKYCESFMKLIFRRCEIYAENVK